MTRAADVKFDVERRPRKLIYLKHRNYNVIKWHLKLRHLADSRET